VARPSCSDLARHNSSLRLPSHESQFPCATCYLVLRHHIRVIRRSTSPHTLSERSLDIAPQSPSLVLHQPPIPHFFWPMCFSTVLSPSRRLFYHRVMLWAATCTHGPSWHSQHDPSCLNVSSDGSGPGRAAQMSNYTPARKKPVHQKLQGTRAEPPALSIHARVAAAVW
jgi:hypothetical protein